MDSLCSIQFSQIKEINEKEKPVNNSKKIVWKKHSNKSPIIVESINTTSDNLSKTGNVCFKNDNFYSRKIILVNIETQLSYEIFINIESSSCRNDIPSGDYMINVYTTFTKTKLGSFRIKINENKTTNRSLDVNHYN